MPSYTDGQGKKKFHINPQAARAFDHKGANKGGMGSSREENAEEQIHPGIHEEVDKKLANYDGHEHNGHKLAEHVETHHGAHPEGQPPAHEGHTHHTISQRHDMHGGGAEVFNHEGYDAAEEHNRGEMHADCPECEEAEGAGTEDEEEPSEEMSEGGEEEE